MARRGKVIPFPGPRPRREPPEPGLVEIRRCHPAEAAVIKALLESEGIPTLLRSRLVASLHPFSVGTQGELAILVPPGEAERSRLLLERQPPG